MGVIQIRERQERLGNLGGVRMADTDIGAARAIAGIAEADAKRRAAPWGVAMNLLGAADKGINAVARATEEFRERLSDERVDAYVADYQQAHDEYNYGSIGSGERTPGAMEGAPADTGLWLARNKGFHEATVKELRKKHKMTDRDMQKAQKRLLGYDLAMQNRWRSHAARVDGECADANANANYEAKFRAAYAAYDQEKDGDAARLLWQEWRDAGEYLLARKGVRPGSETAKAFWRDQGLKMMQARLGAVLATQANVTSAMDAKATKEHYDEFVGRLESEDLPSLLAEDATFTGKDGVKVADYLRDALGDAPLDDFRRAAIEDARSAAKRRVAEVHVQEEQHRQEVVRGFTERELGLRDVPQELWADDYENMGKDEVLRKADPKRAMAYMDAASEMRAAASKAKDKAAADKVKGNEEGLARSLAMLDVLKMDGSLSQDEANEAQAAIWRKFRTLSFGDQLSTAFVRSFETRLSGQLSQQESNAMRKFYRAFGFAPELDNSGEPTATARKNAKTDVSEYYAPLENDGVKVESHKTRVSATELLKYGDALLRTLRALGPDMNREGVVEREIDRLKTEWIKGEVDKNREATVRSMMDMQREMRTRLEISQQNKTGGKNDVEREKTGSPAK